MATDRHTHPVLITVVIACFAVIAVVITVGAVAAINTSHDAQETAEIARAVTDPNCDPRVAACQRANENRARQAAVIPDINEISVIAAFCGNQHSVLQDVRACVEREFKERTGRMTSVGPTTTTTRGD